MKSGVAESFPCVDQPNSVNQIFLAPSPRWSISECTARTWLSVHIVPLSAMVGSWLEMPM
jgi:hypothetical protein